MGNDESHFNFSVVSDGQSHRTVSTNHHLFEEKGEPKRYRTEALPLTNLNALPLGPEPAHAPWAGTKRSGVKALVGTDARALGPYD